MLIFFLGLLKILALKSHNSNTKNNSFGTVSALELTAGNPGALLGWAATPGTLERKWRQIAIYNVGMPATMKCKTAFPKCLSDT